MIISLLMVLLVTLIATWWSRHLAMERGRRAGAWALATAIFPPVVLILWALPRRAASVQSS